MRTRPITLNKPTRTGFTLVELLVVVSIILILATITLVSVNFSNSRDRVRAAGRQLQSFFAGARDRAIYSKEVRGVRLILDPLNKHTAVAVQYIGAPDRWTGSVKFITSDSVTIPSGMSLQNAGILAAGAQIEIPKDSGSFFTVASRAVPNSGNAKDGDVALSRSCPVFNPNVPNQLATFSLALRPTVIPGSEPVPLPTGVVIDLDGSNLPSVWLPSPADSRQPYSATMDILFNPRGNVVGDAAGNGIIHLHLADAGDVLLWQNIQGRVMKLNPSTPSTVTGTPPPPPDWAPPVVPANTGTGTPIVKYDQILVSINGRSGNISVHHVNPTNTSSPAVPVADDPYSLAETGQVSNQ